MTVITNPDAYRASVLGNGPVSKAITLSGAAVHQIFTVTVGEVLITALWAKCTTAMAGANTLNLQVDPTTGDTVVVVTATDLGTTDTAAGTLIGVLYDQDGTSNIPVYSKGSGNVLSGLPVPIGEVEIDCVGAGADGALTVYCTWVPLVQGARLAAAA
jgi:hypothetical protein